MRSAEPCKSFRDEHSMHLNSNLSESIRPSKIIEARRGRSVPFGEQNERLAHGIEDL